MREFNPIRQIAKNIRVRFFRCSISREKRIKDGRTLPVPTMSGETSWIYKMAADFFRAPVWPTYEKLSPRLSASLFHPRGFCRLLSRYPGRSPLRNALRNELGNESEMDITEECSNAHRSLNRLTQRCPAVKIAIKIPICHVQNSMHEHYIWNMLRHRIIRCLRMKTA